MSKLTVITFFIALALTLVFCNEDDKQHVAENEGIYLNLHDTVDYVGMETCRACHQNIYETYIHTGMGKSFDLATKEKSSAVFDKHALVYDKDSDFYYHPFWKDSSLYILEFRLENGDTTHQRLEKISYVIGSGQHTNSHLINQNGYVYQAPITFYTQEGKWDLAPGFEDGENSRFSRIIASECLTCHNHLPQHVEGSENKYAEMPRGIECERCHGPGELHVQAKMAGEIVDTSKYIDYSIVNPANLPVSLEIDICQRCHLQGIAVLNEGKSFYDFRPGMPLNEVMNVFLPRYSDSHESFIMASQADRMKLSKCFTVGEMTCTNCHNPHVSVKETTKNKYNDACKSCHKSLEKEVCTAPMAERQAKKDNCVSCHMPKTGSIDIPHVRITDHYIGKPIKEEEKEEIARFIGLECLTAEEPSDLLMARGYIALYEKFVPEKAILDSVSFYLDKSKAPIEGKFNTAVHYAFEKQDFTTIISLAKSIDPTKMEDGWTAYRIGEAYVTLGDSENANSFFQQAVKLRPYNLDFNNKLGVTFLQLKRLEEATKVFDFILSENDRLPQALNNRGFIHLLKGETDKAERYYRKALTLDPDYEKAWLNLVGYYFFKKDKEKSMALLKKLRTKFPQNEQVKMLLEQLLTTNS